MEPNDSEHDNLISSSDRGLRDHQNKGSCPTKLTTTTTMQVPTTSSTSNTTATTNPHHQAARGTLWGICLKLISFGLNQCTIRLVDPVLLGKANIQLDLLLSSILFLSREGFRLALIRGGTATAAAKGGNSTSNRASNNDSSNKESTETAATNSHNNKNTGVDGDVNDNMHFNNNEDNDDDEQNVINVAWLTVPIGILMSFVAMYAHLHSCYIQKLTIIQEKDTSTFHTSIKEHNDYRSAGILYCVSAMIESLVEPLVILYSLREMDVSTRATAEASAALCKTITTVSLLLFGATIAGTSTNVNTTSSLRLLFSWTATYPVTVFGIGQMVHSIVLCIVYYRKKWNSLKCPSYVRSMTKTITRRSSSSYNYMFDTSLLKLVGIFTVQGLFKHLLTEGDRIVLTSLVDAYDQGLYAMAQSYGGIASRVLLQPLEENARLLFSNQHRIILQTTSQGNAGSSSSTKKNKTKQQLMNDDFQHTLCLLVKLVLHIGLIFSCLGTNYTSLLLQIMAGTKWSTNMEASRVLSSFGVYTSIMAINGITEAFVYGVAQTQRDITQLSVVHAAVGGIFAVLAPTLVKSHGTVGLVVANGICMCLRSIYSLYFATNYFSPSATKEDHFRSSTANGNKTSSKTAAVPKQFVDLLCAMSPSTLVWMAFLVSYSITKKSAVIYLNTYSDGMANAAIQHVSVGIACFVGVASVVYYSERLFLKSLKDILRISKKSNED